MEDLHDSVFFIGRYTYVGALFLSWAPSATDTAEEAGQLRRMKKQSDRLSRLFHDFYNFEVEDYEIPRKKPSDALRDKLTSLRDKYESSQHFLIVYYGGHGGTDRSRDAIWKWSVVGLRPQIT